MAYEVIARKWRPQIFDEVVGQEAITRTLRNAVEQERLHHAYLFTGARGVGKTTTARILAKALNCRTGVTVTPCGVCASCTEIAAGGSLDVIEIDAASHTGVDNIRDVVINSVGIAPARDRYKVFIVDEVHQLSGAAFNALLKTLEEPPSRVVFVLATTELHKVPDTIASRCQLFEFKTIPLTKIQAKLGEIATSMKVDITPAALAAVARAGEGSMRDAQSALDQVIAFSGERIDMPDVATALGIVGDETLYDAIDAISTSDAPAALRQAAKLAEAGHDLRSFTRSLMRTVRNLLVTRAIGYDPELVDAAEADAERVVDLASRFTEAELVRLFSLLTALEQDIRHSADPRFQLEIGLVRMAELPRLRPLDEIIDRLTKLEARLTGESGAVAPSAPARPVASPPPVAPRAAPPAPKRAPAATAPRGAAAPAIPSPAPPRSVADEGPPEPPPFFDDEPPSDFEPAPPRSPSPPRTRSAAKSTAPTAPPVATEPLDGDAAVREIRARLEAQNKMMLLTAFDAATSVAVDGGRLVLSFDAVTAVHGRTAELSKALIESIARDVVGRTVRLAVVVGAADASTAAGAAPSAATQAALEDPAVQGLLEAFQGQLIRVDPPEGESET
ncbi:MAG: DNA polymerase III subunit gamma/tau [Blastocatellia bacterium]|nr:DNA polymerase III subunit gamma/tau [Blastocatellia bacterium]